MKKIEAIFLALCILFSTQAFSAVFFAEELTEQAVEEQAVEVAEETVPLVFEEPDIAFESAEALLKALEMEISDVEVENEVTRGQFLNALVNILTNGDVPKNNPTFTDIDADTDLAYEAAYAQSLNIIGTGASFSPDDTIKAKEAIKMTVCALGYYTRAELMGGYPTGYSKIAKNLDLLKNIDKAGDDTILVRDAYVLLYNMLTTNQYERITYGEYVSYRETDTILHEVYKIDELEGIVNANSDTALSDADGALSDNEIMIGTKIIKFYGKDAPLGYNVKAFCHRTSDADPYTAVVLVPHKNDSVSFVGRDVYNLKNNQFELEKNKKYALYGSYQIILNGKAATIPNLEDFINKNEVDVTIIDNDDDGKYDVVSINNWSYCYVKSVNQLNKYILDQNAAVNSIDLSASDCHYSIEKIVENTTEFINLEDIKAGMLIAAAISNDKKLVRLVLCEKSESITLKGQNTSNKKLIDTEGNKFDYGNYMAKWYSKFTIGQQYNLLLGINGEVVVLSGSSNLGSYAWIVSVAKGKAFEQDKIKLFTSDGKMLITEISKKPLLDGISISTDALYTRLSGLIDSERLVKYTTNSDGEILNVDLAKPFDGTEPYLTDDAEKDSLRLFYNGNFQYRNGLFDGSFSSNGACIFSIPTEDERNDDDAYDIVSADQCSSNSKTSLIVYDCDEMGCSSAMVSIGGTLKSKTTTTTVPGVVQEVCNAINSDGEDCFQYVIFSAGKYIDIITNSKTTGDIATVRPGDIVRCTVAKDGYLMDIYRDFEYKTKTMITTETMNPMSGFCYMSGPVYNYNATMVSILDGKSKVLPNQAISISDIRLCKLVANKTSYVYVMKDKNGEVESVTVRPVPQNSIQGYLNAADKASFFVTNMDYYNPRWSFFFIEEQKN